MDEEKRGSWRKGAEEREGTCDENKSGLQRKRERKKERGKVREEERNREEERGN